MNTVRQVDMDMVSLSELLLLVLMAAVLSSAKVIVWKPVLNGLTMGSLAGLGIRSAAVPISLLYSYCIVHHVFVNRLKLLETIWSEIVFEISNSLLKS